MTKFVFSIVGFALTGCASMGDWRELTIDGTSAAAFNESLSHMDNELSTPRSDMLTLALADIVRTEAERSEQTGEDAYSYERLRSQLDGLTYDGVIALADQTGPSISILYTRQRNSSAGLRSGPGSVPQADTFTFSMDPVVPPGMPAGMASGMGSMTP